MQKISPCLWFDSQAEEAANFYVSVFKNSRVTAMTRYGDEGPGTKGMVMTVAFELDGQEYLALNGGPQFTFSEAVSFIVNCESQAEVDRLWSTLSAGGEESQCGWLKDKYGLSWQIVPIALTQMLNDADPARAQRVMTAVLQMRKIDIAVLQAAYEQQ